MPYANLQTRREYLRKWKARNKAKIAAYAKQDRQKHPERFRRHDAAHRARNLMRIRARQKARAAARRVERPDTQKEVIARTLVKRTRRLEVKAGRPKPTHCERCKEFHRYICFDHDHKTGMFRGWLCDRCNKVLGLVYDNPATLRALADYLEEHGDKPNSGQASSDAEV